MPVDALPTELIPAAVAVTGGAVLGSAIYLHEQRREETMRRSREVLALTFPIGTSAEVAAAALEALSGLSVGTELVAEVASCENGIAHLLHIPSTSIGSVSDTLTAAIPGLRLDTSEPRSTGSVTLAARITVPLGALLREENTEGANRALLRGLARLRADERASLRWALRPAPAPDLPVRLQKQPVSPRSRIEARAWRHRLARPGFRVTGLLLVRAEDPQRARGLLEHVLATLRSRRGPGLGLLSRPGRASRSSSLPRTGRSRGWLSAGELVALLGWPLGKEAIEGVQLGAARRLPVPRELPSEGRVLLVGADAYGRRPVALSAEAARHHLAVLGPTGVGKSSLLGGMILQDIAHGHGGVLLDPKQQLAHDVLERVGRGDAERVVVLDPAAPGPQIGLDLFGRGDPEQRSEAVVGVMRSIYADVWGVRTDSFLRLVRAMMVCSSLRMTRIPQAGSA